MPRLGDLVPDVEVLLAMEPEQLAGCLLQVMNSRPGREKMLTIGSWLYELFQGPTPRFRTNTTMLSFVLWLRHGIGWRCRV